MKYKSNSKHFTLKRDLQKQQPIRTCRGNYKSVTCLVQMSIGQTPSSHAILPLDVLYSAQQWPTTFLRAPVPEVNSPVIHSIDVS